MINWYKFAQTQEMYHVTLTEHIPSIQERGILPQGGPSNWTKGNGERYGQGDVHAMQSLKDAIKWGSQWDWHLSSQFGSGKISIVKFTNDDNPWETDESDPLSQSGMDEAWLKRVYGIAPENILDIIPLTHELVIKTLRN